MLCFQTHYDKFLDYWEWRIVIDGKFILCRSCKNFKSEELAREHANKSIQFLAEQFEKTLVEVEAATAVDEERELLWYQK